MICDLVMPFDCHPGSWWDLRKSHYFISSTEQPSEAGLFSTCEGWVHRCRNAKRCGDHCVAWEGTSLRRHQWTSFFFFLFGEWRGHMRGFLKLPSSWRKSQTGPHESEPVEGKTELIPTGTEAERNQLPEAEASGLHGKPFIHSIHSTIICWVSLLSGERRCWRCSGG